MNSPHTSDSLTQSYAEQDYTPVPNAYSPSVPISVYRDLAAELQATKATVDSLTTQNQQLVRQNQYLRHEIQKLVQATSQLGQLAGVSASFSVPERHAEPDDLLPEPPVSSPEALNQMLPLSLMPKKKGALVPTAKPNPEKYTTEQGALPRRYGASRNAPTDFSGLWLAVSILLVIFTAFGAGFLIMRPLLSDQ